MTHQTEAELLPCPFCGGKAEAKKPDMSYEFTLIKCQECDAQTDEGVDFDDAAEAWNRRAPAAPQTAPISDELPQGFISDVLTAAGLVRHGKQCKALADRLGDAIQKIWTTSIAQRKAIAAAPQPPACNQSMQHELATYSAPVQLPEPTAYLYHDAPTLEDYIANERAGIPINSACIGVKRIPHCRNETPLYTEHQVRQLLAQHGIK